MSKLFFVILVLLGCCSTCMAVDYVIIGAAGGGGLAVIILLIIVICCCVRSRKASDRKEAKRIATEQEQAAAAKRRDFEEMERQVAAQRQMQEQEMAEVRRREIEQQQMAIAEEANRRQFEEQQALENRKKLLKGVPIIRESPPPAQHHQYQHHSQFQTASYSNIERFEPYRGEIENASSSFESQVQTPPVTTYDPYQEQRPASAPQRKIATGKNPFGFPESGVAWRPNSLHYDYQQNHETEGVPQKDIFVQVLPEIPRAHQFPRHNSSSRREENRPVVPKKPTKYYNGTEIPAPDY